MTVVFPELHLSDSVSLRLTSPADAAEIFAIVEGNRAHLGRWLAWLPHVRNVEEVATNINNAMDEFARGASVPVTIRRAGHIVGRMSMHNIDRLHKTAELGYWLAQNTTGRGVMTRAAHAFMNYGLTSLQLHRIEVMTAVDNASACRVAERLGMTLEARLRERLYLNGGFYDAVLYAKLAQDGERTTREEE